MPLARQTVYGPETNVIVLTSTINHGIPAEAHGMAPNILNASGMLSTLSLRPVVQDLIVCPGTCLLAAHSHCPDTALWIGALT